MELVQKDLRGNTPVARASAKCWKNTWMSVRPRFERTTGQTLHEGMKVLLQVYAQSIVYYNLPLYLIHEIAGSASRGVDYTKLAKSHVITMRSVAEVKRSLRGSREQKAIFDYVVYQLLSNTIQEFAASKELTYEQFKMDVSIEELLPLDTQCMYNMKSNARLMNVSIPLFYFLAWVKKRR